MALHQNKHDTCVIHVVDGSNNEGFKLLNFVPLLSCQTTVDGDMDKLG